MVVVKIRFVTSTLLWRLDTVTSGDEMTVYFSEPLRQTNLNSPHRALFAIASVLRFMGPRFFSD